MMITAMEFRQRSMGSVGKSGTEEGYGMGLPTVEFGDLRGDAKAKMKVRLWKEGGASLDFGG